MNQSDNFTNFNPNSDYDRNLSVFASKLTQETKEMDSLRTIYFFALFITLICNITYYFVALVPIKEEQFD